ncbi:hypothetical protein FOL47_010249 [Perkinsus chesapeaki]|uniref:Uncharacterized protein n=1 Tax=Perkinsus chesapeaki TaxID=330153 RepID=A0A7J6MQJ3_PERCH|nr:hypothetical protein FOL47_010249 [Perkinsus chesapeaki]
MLLWVEWEEAPCEDGTRINLEGIFTRWKVVVVMYGKGAGYWQQQQQYGGGYQPAQRLNGGKGSWYGDWTQPAYRSYNKGGRKGKGKGHRWNNDAESLRELPIERFIQDDMVIDPWSDLYPKCISCIGAHTAMSFNEASPIVPKLLTPEAAERLLEQRDGVVYGHVMTRDTEQSYSKLARLNEESKMIAADWLLSDWSKGQAWLLLDDILLESLDTANRLATAAYERSHHLFSHEPSDGVYRPDWSYLRPPPTGDPSRVYHTSYRPLSAPLTAKTSSSSGATTVAAGQYAARYRGMPNDTLRNSEAYEHRVTAADLGALTSVSYFSSTDLLSSPSITPSSLYSESFTSSYIGDAVDHSERDMGTRWQTEPKASTPALLHSQQRLRRNSSRSVNAMNTSSSSRSFSSLYDRHEAWAMKRRQKIEERRREKEDRSMQDCHFKPRTTHHSEIKTRIGPQQTKEWEQRRKAREREREEAKEEQEIAACTFEPDIGKSQRKRKGSSRIFEDRRSSSALLLAAEDATKNTFKPSTNPVRHSMRHARQYTNNNVFHRLASHGGKRLEEKKKSIEQRVGGLSEEQIQKIMHNFLQRQEERETRRKEHLANAERKARAECTHEPRICEYPTLYEFELERDQTPTVTAKAKSAPSRTIFERSYGDLRKKEENIERLSIDLKKRKAEKEANMMASTPAKASEAGRLFSEVPSRLRLEIDSGSDYMRRVAKERERRDEARRLREAEQEALEMAECSFKPLINKPPRGGDRQMYPKTHITAQRNSYGSNERNPQCC